ncbi:hypothetical protein PODOV084v1_p0026 [Vibrio phage 340E47.2]|nr:hypothetical protein PODOV084v1_p0026 [Vibrio phage 340E47.2]QZI91931.1 hypothetical protein PODOV077v1_p0020 [Vibrio phage 5P1a]
MTSEDLKNIIINMKPGTIMQRVAIVHLESNGRISDKQVSELAGVSKQQAGEARVALKKHYGVDFVRTGTLTKYKFLVKLDGRRIKIQDEPKDYSCMATLQRAEPLCWFFGLAKPPKPV